MARKYQSAGASSGYTILVIDDSPDILGSTRRLLESEGHRVLTAPDGPSGLALLQQERVSLILVDYFMPEMTGEEVVRRVRERDSIVQIILQTGYAGEKPARVMMRELEIQGYHDKGDGAERLLLWVDTALKAYRHVVAMEKHRRGLRYILDLTPELHRVQPIGELLEGLLWQVEAILGADNSFVATIGARGGTDSRTEGFVALVDNTELQIRFGTGRFSGSDHPDRFPEREQSLIQRAIERGSVCVEEGASAVPLILGDRPVGIIFLDRPAGEERDREVLSVFANQAAAAVQNSLLFDLATVDSLTGAYLRGFAVQQLRHAVKRCLRRGDPLSLLMIDLDRFKQINDRFGHLIGDRALARVGRLLAESVRETDIVGRYGGDEFMVILPDTPAAGALIAANRLLHRAGGLHVEVNELEIPIHLSLGISTIQLTPEEAQVMVDPAVLDQAVEGLIASADQALYAAKGSGRPGEGAPVSWPGLLATAGV